MCSISIRPERHSYDIIKRTGEFVINLTTEDLAKATDWCGCRSGRKYNKWKEMNLTSALAKTVKAPIIEESPVNIECRVKDILELGTHHMFIAEVMNISVDDNYIDEYDVFDFSKTKPIVYSHGHYFGMGSKIGKFGWSVEKKKNKKHD